LVESGPEIAFDGVCPERSVKAQYSDVILEGRLRTALRDINPNIPPSAIDDAVRKIVLPESPSLIENNRRFHRILTDGVDVSYMEDSREKFDKVWLFDLENLENNDWLVVNQFTVIENGKNRRPDLVVFVNGLPFAVIELKNPADEKATIRQAFNQLQTYKQDVPGLFTYNALLIISDGLEARTGTLTSGWDRFMPWRTIDGDDVAPKGSVELEVLIKGIFEKHRFLDLILNFIVFEDDGAEVVKKVAAYHQYHAVNKAVECTLSACGVDAKPRQLYAEFPALDELNPFEVREPTVPYEKASTHFGGRRIGVIWHTQGSGKRSLPTATIWTTSFSGHFRDAETSCVKRRFRRIPESIFVLSWMFPLAGWCSPRFRSLCQMRRVIGIRSYLIGKILLSLPMRPTAASMTLSMAMPATCTMPCLRHHSSALPQRQSKGMTGALLRFSVIISIPTICFGLLKTKQLYLSITKEGLQK
jgi:hypothetical protein